jgi:hypothetical protein
MVEWSTNNDLSAKITFAFDSLRICPQGKPHGADSR